MDRIRWLSRTRAKGIHGHPQTRYSQGQRLRMTSAENRKS